VLGSASATDETSDSILNSLKTLNQAVGNTKQQRVAVVEARRHKYVDYCLPCLYRQRSNERAELAKIVVC